MRWVPQPVTGALIVNAMLELLLHNRVTDARPGLIEGKAKRYKGDEGAEATQSYSDVQVGASQCLPLVPVSWNFTGFPVFSTRQWFKDGVSDLSARSIAPPHADRL
jgi:hypothetical protein